MGSSPLSNEEYLMTAFAMNSSDFLDFFSEVSPQVHRRYEELCRENNTLDEFRGNPLVFILANNPTCCAHIARSYIDRCCAAAGSRSITEEGQPSQPSQPSQPGSGRMGPAVSRLANEQSEACPAVP
mmetsp:Transcript_46251/g.106772  ORF Transcript_46251/g.106772 Transcript_46251/m.106772 type:complete len:127 (-) Transcript_46251:161-541(-)